jgi:hypothetical protein
MRIWRLLATTVVASAVLFKSLTAIGNNIDGQYVAGYEVTYVDRTLNNKSKVGDTDVFSMMIKGGKVVDIIVENDPGFNRATRNYDDVVVDVIERTVKGTIRQRGIDQGTQVRVDLLVDIVFGDQSFVGGVDIKLVSAGGRSFNKRVESGVFEGIKAK